MYVLERGDIFMPIQHSAADDTGGWGKRVHNMQQEIPLPKNLCARTIRSPRMSLSTNSFCNSYDGSIERRRLLSQDKIAIEQLLI